MGAGKGNNDNGAFSGFSPQTLEFLRGLAGNNSKPWFDIAGVELLQGTGVEIRPEIFFDRRKVKEVFLQLPGHPDPRKILVALSITKPPSHLH